MSMLIAAAFASRLDLMFQLPMLLFLLMLWCCDGVVVVVEAGLHL